MALTPNAVTPMARRILRKPGSSDSASTLAAAQPSPSVTSLISSAMVAGCYGSLGAVAGRLVAAADGRLGRWAVALLERTGDAHSRDARGASAAAHRRSRCPRALYRGVPRLRHRLYDVRRRRPRRERRAGHGPLHSPLPRLCRRMW